MPVGELAGLTGTTEARESTTDDGEEGIRKRKDEQGQISVFPIV